MDPINIKLLTLDGNAYVRIIDENNVFAYGTNWSILLNKTFDPHLVGTLLSMQSSSSTVFNVGVLSCSTQGLLQGAQNNSFKAHGSMTSETLSFRDPEWERFYHQALEQVHYTTRPGPYQSLNTLIGEGKSTAIYHKNNNDSRKFVEKGVPTADLIEFIVEHHTQEPFIVHIPGNLMRFAQNMGIELMLPVLRFDTGEDIESITDIVPWIVGSQESSWLMVRPSIDHNTSHSGRNLHTRECLACWGSSNYATSILLQSKSIYSNMATLSMLQSEDILCEADLNVERKNLNLRSWYEEYCPELFAIDILRYQGWSSEEIQAFLARSYEDAWLCQAKIIASNLLRYMEEGDQHSIITLEHILPKQIDYLVDLAHYSSNPEVADILHWACHTFNVQPKAV